ncbi:luciferin 4-monooxygenase-like [Plodia interpunctella]|uniref:luciferin 4-monooxygenase-like n=1 Tax=Plodia interpunctella TaxID=58824 RepID=UPI0023677F86|nr:luciferin 4-monooxygenase-like [Plodia interpunctella]
MLKNPLYVYGPKNVYIPSDLNFAAFFLDTLWEHRNNVALINGASYEDYTYLSMAQQSMNVAISLSRLGVKKGEVVAICSENRMEYWAAFLGTVCAGVTATMVNPNYTGNELKHVLSITKPKYMFCSQTFYNGKEKTLKSLPYLKKIILFGDKTNKNVLYYDDLAISVDGNEKDIGFNGNKLSRNVRYEEFRAVDVEGQNDVALILYSSGTTGLPKGVMLTHVNLLSACLMPASIDPKLNGLTISPWFHTMGLIGTALGLCKGRTLVYLPKFEINLYLKCIEKYQIQQITVVPPVLVAACKSQEPYDLSSVKLVYSGAAPLQEETIKIVKDKFPNVVAVLQGYGMTEMTLAVIKSTYDQTVPMKSASIGSVVAGAIVKVVDIETGKPLGPNQSGELCFKSTQVMKGYVGKSNREFFDDEGFYRSGDIGYYDEDRQFYIVDRLKELIKYKGFQVAPAEIESLLLQHPSVRDAGVVGLPDPTAGELPLAFVVKQPGCDVSELEIQAFVAEKLSNPKHLRGGVRFVSEIPKNPSGKVLRKALKAMMKNTKSKL